MRWIRLEKLTYKPFTEINNKQDYIWPTGSRKALDNAIVFTLTDLKLNREYDYLEKTYPKIVRKIILILKKITIHPSC